MRASRRAAFQLETFDRISEHGWLPAYGHRTYQRQLRAQTMVAPGGTRGRVAKKAPPGWAAGQGYRRNGDKLDQCGAKSQSSTHHKLERKRIVAAGSRTECKEREAGWNRLRPGDFEEPAQRRANGTSPKVNRRSSVNRSSCGRRTSLGPAQLIGAFRSGVTYIYSDCGDV
jgi:hypothetical protein